jgi:hypothetical protein
MAVQVKVSGINTLIENIEQYSEKVQVGILKEIKDWSVRTESAAQRDVPVDTGALKSSIGTYVENNGLTWVVKAGGTEKVNYAPFIEFGTGARVDKSFLQQFGLTEYASQFKGKQDPFFALPSRSFLYRNARIEFEKSLENIKKLIQKNDKT